MQTPNNPGEENRTLWMALELYRLQSVRNMLLVVLMIQLLLIGIGVTLVLQGMSRSQANTRLSPNSSANSRRHNSGEALPDEIYRAPADHHVVADKACFATTCEVTYS